MWPDVTTPVADLVGLVVWWERIINEPMQSIPIVLLVVHRCGLFKQSHKTNNVVQSYTNPIWRKQNEIPDIFSTYLAHYDLACRLWHPRSSRSYRNPRALM